MKALAKPANQLIVLFCSLFLFACSSASDETTCAGDGDCQAGELCIDDLCIEAKCRTGADCPGKAACVEHVCVADLLCETDYECDLGEICRHYQCEPGCKYDFDCPRFHLCPPDGQCAQCLLDPDCSTGFVCEDGRCVPGCVWDADCPEDLVCVGGECGTGCVSHDDCPDGFCDPLDHICVECVVSDDCDPGVTCSQGACIKGCVTDAGCPDGYECSANECLKICSTREDCEPPLCLCEDGNCARPAAVCETNDDCCLSHECVDGTCYPDDCGCYTSADCLDPKLPRCRDCACVAECQIDVECPLAGQICVEERCQNPECEPASCTNGQWCDTADGQCKRGCDHEADCLAPATCDIEAHQCVPPDCCGGCPEDETCDPLTCHCLTACQGATDCPAGFSCENDGVCWCTADVCPPGTSCDDQTGECLKDPCQTDQDCLEGQICRQATHHCLPSSAGKEGDGCFRDEECDLESGLRCDNDFFCLECAADPEFAPSFTCRIECFTPSLSCPIGGRSCRQRKSDVFLCVPSG